MRTKRVVDFLGALFGVVLTAPIWFVVAILVRWKLGSPVIYSQPRPGLNGKIFYIKKFRTMTNETDENGVLLPNEMRKTKFGSLLRSTSLDELPELLNVLKGEMSLVGPRPLRVEYLPRYSKEQARRHDVPPGVTGWAQVRGRNNLTWEEKFKLDVWYVDNRSLWLDLKIIFMTIYKVIKREGADNIATGEGAFLGNAVETSSTNDEQNAETTEKSA
ncbi:MAG: sugar transferase [Thermoguttaceae bacterium]|nr:sugar transferase [Thermoguttaceae bacterium]